MAEQTLQQHLDTAVNEMKSLIERQSTEIKNYGAVTDKTAAEYKKIDEKIVQLSADIQGKVDDAEKKSADFQARIEDLEKKANRLPGPMGMQQKSIAQRFVEDEEIKRCIAQKSYNSGAVNVGSFFERKDLSTFPTSLGIDILPQRVPGLWYDPAQRPKFMRDIMSVGTTTSNAVEFIQETLFLNNATPTDDHGMSVATRELGVVSDDEYIGGEKARSEFSFEKISQPVETIAHWVPATRQALSDEPMLMSYVQDRLLYGVKLAEDTQILGGTGTGGQFLGFGNHPGVQNAGAPAGGITVIDHIRNALTLARTAQYIPDAIILNPVDWAAIELVAGANGQYVYGNPNGSEPTTLWRIPVVETTACPANNFLLGSFRMGASLWDREQATVRISEHHARYFVQNLIAILAEERLTMTIYRPQAFVRGTFA